MCIRDSFQLVWEQLPEGQDVDDYLYWQCTERKERITYRKPLGDVLNTPARRTWETTISKTNNFFLNTPGINNFLVEPMELSVDVLSKSHLYLPYLHLPDIPHITITFVVSNCMCRNRFVLKVLAGVILEPLTSDLSFFCTKFTVTIAFLRTHLLFRL